MFCNPYAPLENMKGRKKSTKFIKIKQALRVLLQIKKKFLKLLFPFHTS